MLPVGLLGLKYQIPTGRKLRGFACGPQVFITVPTGNAHGAATFPMGYKPPTLPEPTGNDTVDIEARLSTGYSFYPLPMFATAEAGYHHHFNSPCQAADGTPLNYSDDIPWSIQFGASWTPKKKGFHHGTLIAVVNIGYGLTSISGVASEF